MNRCVYCFAFHHHHRLFSHLFHRHLTENIIAIFILSFFLCSAVAVVVIFCSKNFAECEIFAIKSHRVGLCNCFPFLRTVFSTQRINTKYKRFSTLQCNQINKKERKNLFKCKMQERFINDSAVAAMVIANTGPSRNTIILPSFKTTAT